MSTLHPHHPNICPNRSVIHNFFLGHPSSSSTAPPPFPAPFVLLDDAPSQSGVPILKELIVRSAARRQPVLLLTFNNNPTRLACSGGLGDQDTDPWVTSIDLSLLPLPDSSATSSSNALLQTEDSIHKIMAETESARRPMTVIVDSLFHAIQLWSFDQVFRLLKGVLRTLSSSGSRLVVLNSPYLYPTTSPTQADGHRNGSQIFSSASFAPSLLHLKIHPTALLDHILNSLGIPFPQPCPGGGTLYDRRLFPLLDELSNDGGHGNAYLSSATTSKKQDAQIRPPLIPQALLLPPKDAVDNLGSCILEWTSKSVADCFSSSSASISSSRRSAASHTSSSSTTIKFGSVQHGLEALELVLLPQPDAAVPSPTLPTFYLRVVPVSHVVKQKPHHLPLDHHHQLSSLEKHDSGNQQLTFNLSLTDRQRAARDKVDLPYLPRRADDGTVVEAPGEIYDGSFRDPKSKNKGGMIIYQPDSADDMDDEEPDDEL